MIYGGFLDKTDKTRFMDGFGMRHDPHPINGWPACCGEWMKSMGFLGN